MNRSALWTPPVKCWEVAKFVFKEARTRGCADIERLAVNGGRS